MKNRKNLTRITVEASLMIAFATVLSLFKLVEMPYGGSITPASMFPILIVSYRHGARSGFLSALVFAVIQQLLGLNNLTYVTGWVSVVAVIILVHEHEKITIRTEIMLIIRLILYLPL